MECTTNNFDTENLSENYSKTAWFALLICDGCHQLWGCWQNDEILVCKDCKKTDCPFDNNDGEPNGTCVYCQFKHPEIHKIGETGRHVPSYKPLR